MAAGDALDRHRKWLVPLAVVVGVVLIVIAVIYWIEPASSLPSFFPGHEAGSSHHHVKHGVAALIVALACFVFAWFQSGPTRDASGPTARRCGCRSFPPRGSRRRTASAGWSRRSGAATSRRGRG